MTTRQAKVQQLIKHEVSDIIIREFKDPRKGFITITDVEVSGDMRHARVFVSVLGDEDDKKRNLKILNNAAHFIRGSLSKRIEMKAIPDLEFKLDTSADQGIRIMELLEQVKREEKNK